MSQALDDHQLAAELAREAGQHLLALRATGDHEGKVLAAEGDRTANELLLAGLAGARPADAVLSEESPDDTARLSAERVWIIDPLDGTREYSEGRHDWAVHVALWQQGDLVAGAVALPGVDEVHVTQPAPDAQPLHDGPVRIAVSRSRPPAWATELAEAIGGELVPMGSAGYKVLAVVRGEVDLYAHAGGQYEWDSAAPVAVARATGLHTSRVDGSPLLYNQPSPWLPDLLICRPALATQVLPVLARLGVS